MKKSQDGFIVPILLVIVALLAVGSGVYVYKNKSTKGITEQTQNQNTNVSTSPDPTVGWKTYTDTTKGFEFKYPEQINGDSVEAGALTDAYFLTPYFTDDFVQKNNKGYFQFIFEPLVLPKTGTGPQGAVTLNTRNDPAFPNDVQEYTYDQNSDMWYGTNGNSPDIKVKYFTWEELYNRFANVNTCYGLTAFKPSEHVYALPFSGMPTYDGKVACGYHILDSVHKTAFILRYEYYKSINGSIAEIIKNVVKTIKLPSEFAQSVSGSQLPPVQKITIPTNTTGWQTYMDRTHGFEIKYPNDWTQSSAITQSENLKSVFTITNSTDNPNARNVRVYVGDSQADSEACRRTAFAVGDLIISENPVKREQVGNTVFNIYEFGDQAMGGAYSQSLTYVTTTPNRCYAITSYFQGRRGSNEPTGSEAMENIVHTFRIVP